MVGIANARAVRYRGSNIGDEERVSAPALSPKFETGDVEPICLACSCATFGCYARGDGNGNGQRAGGGVTSNISNTSAEGPISHHGFVCWDRADIRVMILVDANYAGTSAGQVRVTPAREVAGRVRQERSCSLDIEVTKAL